MVFLEQAREVATSTKVLLSSYGEQSEPRNVDRLVTGNMSVQVQLRSMLLMLLKLRVMTKVKIWKQPKIKRKYREE